MAMTVPSQIDEWIGEPSESPSLEFKEAKNQFDRTKLCEYCVAIANEGGGRLVLGVSDARPRRVVGTKAFQNTVSIAEHIFQMVGFRVNVEAVEHSSGRVVVFDIPPRPPGTPYHLCGRYLMRSGSSLVPMSPDQLRRIFAEGNPHWGESHGLTGLTADGVMDALDTRALFERLGQPYPATQSHVIDSLISEELIDRTPSGLAIRRIGGLLFANRLDAFPDLVSKAPRVIVYGGRNKLNVRLDHTGARGYAVSFPQLVRHVASNLPHNEVIADALRTEVKLLPDDAIRELIANALIHQDLSVQGMSPTIEIYSNRVEISNPGEPVVPVERFIDGYRSRNERLAHLMRRMSICEERGSGVDRVVSLAETLQLPAPYFGTQHGRTIVAIYGQMPFDEMDRDDRLRACYQHCTLKWLMSQRMTNQSLRERFGLPNGKQAAISQVINAAVEGGLIRLDHDAGDSRRYARYLPFWA